MGYDDGAHKEEPIIGISKNALGESKFELRLK